MKITNIEDIVAITKMIRASLLSEMSTTWWDINALSRIGTPIQEFKKELITTDPHRISIELRKSTNPILLPEEYWITAKIDDKHGFTWLVIDGIPENRRNKKDEHANSAHTIMCYTDIYLKYKEKDSE